jgi:flagellin
MNWASITATGTGTAATQFNATSNTLNVTSDYDTIRNTVSNIKAALQSVSTMRSDMGAVQNRLEHTVANLKNVVENTTAAESSIRDTDMASEMVKFANNNILAQAGQAMLAQANQANQGVLALL